MLLKEFMELVPHFKDVAMEERLEWMFNEIETTQSLPIKLIATKILRTVVAEDRTVFAERLKQQEHWIYFTATLNDETEPELIYQTLWLLTNITSLPL